MASKARITSTFIAELLAPLPDGSEAVDDKAYLRTLKADMEAVWRKGMIRVHIAGHERSAEDLRRVMAARDGVKLDSSECFQRYLEECSRQMMIPAPGKAALAWKIDTRKFDGGRQSWEDQIAIDQAWVDGLAAAGIRI
ncbi:hypothetical protein [Sphingomonas kyeonggiensis]|uniref:Uncharacterized protein n=1 Tax=Sphingomonas kyeonggiensis TaxID=1268553 RepID=A0A7W6JUL3_9SPHN|nr:hypothetical protein [Sphingomonas kyeonggiensis]MBB4099775.1 hypothetical protein [Sphingomonas kyeonggiensis]